MNLGALLWLLLCPAARAVGNAGIPGQQPPTVQELAQDLGDGDAPERRFAARSLRGMVRQDVRRSARANAPGVDLAEARLALQVYDDLVAPACIEALTLPEVTGACADILRQLETPAALEPLRAALLVEVRNGARRRLARAIRFLELVQAEAPAEAAEPPG